jgi:hypothetical protein
MAYTLNLPVLNRYTKYFNALAKAGIEFEIQVGQQYHNDSGEYAAVLSPLIKNITTFEALGKVWEAGTSTVKTSQLTDFKELQEIYQKPNAAVVTAEHYKRNNASVKFYAEEVFKKLTHLGVHLLTDPPAERRIGEHTYRISITPGDFYHSEIVYCAPETNEYYNYIDKGHILISTSAADKPESYFFVTNMVTLDMNYILAAFAIYPEAVMAVVPNKVFLPAKDVRLQLMKVERAIPPRFQKDYQKLKAEILTDFEKNTQNVMIGKLTRGEAPYIDINNIRISTTKAVYAAGHVSIEAANLHEVIFQSLNPNEEWDIFTLINIYTDWVEAQFKSLPMNDDNTGFKEKKTFEFVINGIPLKIECFVENTRRAVNGHLINVDELSKVMRRAACFLPEEDEAKKDEHINGYNNFVKEVARISLKSRDVLANGLPVKTLFLDTDNGAHGKDATAKHPRLRFTRKDKQGFFLVVKYYDKKGKIKETNERRIGKFAEFIKKVEKANRETHFYHYTNDREWARTHEGGWERADGTPNACAVKILDLLTTYAADISDDDKKELVGSINKELSEAEKRSEELLQDAIKAVGAKKSQRGGKPGYIIKGQLREYFVEEDALRVYDNKSGDYLCVVNGNGDQGVGKDSLVTRLYALYNDSMITNLVGTLTNGLDREQLAQVQQ